MDNLKPILFIFGALFLTFFFTLVRLLYQSAAFGWRIFFFRVIFSLFTLEFFVFSPFFYIYICAHANFRCIIPNGDKVPKTTVHRNKKWKMEYHCVSTFLYRPTLNVRTYVIKSHLVFISLRCLSLSVIHFVSYDFFLVFFVATLQFSTHFSFAFGFVLLFIQYKIFGV